MENDIPIVFGILMESHGPWQWKLCGDCGACAGCPHFQLCKEMRPVIGDRNHVRIGDVLDSFV